VQGLVVTGRVLWQSEHDRLRQLLVGRFPNSLYKHVSLSYQQINQTKCLGQEFIGYGIGTGAYCYKVTGTLYLQAKAEDRSVRVISLKEVLHKI
jgi:hypothetical protein